MYWPYGASQIGLRLRRAFGIVFVLKNSDWPTATVGHTVPGFVTVFRDTRERADQPPSPGSMERYHTIPNLPLAGTNPFSDVYSRDSCLQSAEFAWQMPQKRMYKAIDGSEHGRFAREFLAGSHTILLYSILLCTAVGPLTHFPALASPWGP